MNLKNYTSAVSADRSISKIEKLLVSIGATNINKQYAEEQLSAISFLVNVNGTTLAFKLPAKIGMVEKVLKEEIKRPRAETYKRIADQSERTAWKIVCDWVEIQVSMIKLQQAEFVEIFLPYAYDIQNDQTFYEKLKDSGFKQLPAYSA